MSQYKIFVDGAHVWKLYETLKMGWPDVTALAVTFIPPQFVSSIIEIVVVDGDTEAMEQYTDAIFRQGSPRYRWHQDMRSKNIKVELVGFKLQTVACEQGLVQQGGDTLITAYASLAVAAGYNVAIMTNDSDFLPPLRLLSSVKRPTQSLEVWMCSTGQSSFSQDLINGSSLGSKTNYVARTYSLIAPPGSPAKIASPKRPTTSSPQITASPLQLSEAANEARMYASSVARTQRPKAIAVISDSPIVRPPVSLAEAAAAAASDSSGSPAPPDMLEEESPPYVSAVEAMLDESSFKYIDTQREAEELIAEMRRISTLDLTMPKPYPGNYMLTSTRTGHYSIMDSWLPEMLAYSSSLSEISDRIFRDYKECSWILQVPMAMYPGISSGAITTTRTFLRSPNSDSCLILIFADRSSSVIAPGFAITDDDTRSLDPMLVGIKVEDYTNTSWLSRKLFIKAVGVSDANVPLNVVTVDGPIEGISIMTNPLKPGAIAIVPTKVGTRWMYSMLFYHQVFHRI